MGFDWDTGMYGGMTRSYRLVKFIIYHSGSTAACRLAQTFARFLWQLYTRDMYLVIMWVAGMKTGRKYGMVHHVSIETARWAGISRTSLGPTG
jgi:hypothetical protein